MDEKKRPAEEASAASEEKPPAEEPSAASGIEKTRGTGGAGSGGGKAEPRTQERIEGLQGWMAELERRQGRMIYFGAAACVLAALAAAAALYIALSAQSDSATKDDLDQLQEQVDGIQQTVKQATESQLKGVNDRLGSIDSQLDDLQQKQAQDAQDIASLEQKQSSLSQRVASAEASGGGGGGGSAAGGGTATGGQRTQPGP
jgi:hypothetical protein